MVRLLALGDSYTEGTAVEPAAAWPMQLAALLRQDGLALAEPVIVAKGGWTTAELLNGIAAGPPAGVFDFVTLLIGVNNQYRGLGLEEYRQELGTLLRQAIGFAGERPDHVLALSIPDYSVTPFAAAQPGVAANLAAYNEAKRLAAIAQGVRYLDITTVCREMGTNADLLAEDELHPSAAMYGRWAQMIRPIAVAVLSGP